MRLAAALVLVAALVGCGGDDREIAPVAWCNNTGQLLYLLDRDDWEGPNRYSG